MQLVLDNIAAQEAALTAMFAGTRSSSTVVERIAFIPDSTEVNAESHSPPVGCRRHSRPGNLAGAPITLDLTILNEGTLPVNEKGETKRFPKGGVALQHTRQSAFGHKLQRTRDCRSRYRTGSTRCDIRP